MILQFRALHLITLVLLVADAFVPTSELCGLKASLGTNFRRHPTRFDRLRLDQFIEESFDDESWKISNLKNKFEPIMGKEIRSVECVYKCFGGECTEDDYISSLASVVMKIFLCYTMGTMQFMRPIGREVSG